MNRVLGHGSCGFESVRTTIVQPTSIVLEEGVLYFCYAEGTSTDGTSANRRLEEIHPLWLRERSFADECLDSSTQQRLYDPGDISPDIEIESIEALSPSLLLIAFSDGHRAEYSLERLASELVSSGYVTHAPHLLLWDSSLEDYPEHEWGAISTDSKNLLEFLEDFYSYGFVLVNGCPAKRGFLTDFAEPLGGLRGTNFGAIFNVENVPDPCDMAYTARGLKAHVDNPYRNPQPGLQALHCIENEVSGGRSTLVNGVSVAEHIRKTRPDYFEILTTVPTRYHWWSDDQDLEEIVETISLDYEGRPSLVRYSDRVEYPLAASKEKLSLFYHARRYLSQLIHGGEFEVSFQLVSGRLVLMDNLRVMHGRTEFNPNEGYRLLQGGYLDHDTVGCAMRMAMRTVRSGGDARHVA